MRYDVHGTGHGPRRVPPVLRTPAGARGTTCNHHCPTQRARRAALRVFATVVPILLIGTLSTSLDIRDAAAQSRKPALDIELYRSLQGEFAYDFVGFWSDGTTLWVDRPPYTFSGNIAPSFSGETLHAYDLATGTRDAGRDVPVVARAPRTGARHIGIWSDGTTLWVVRGGNLYAYNLATRTRNTARDIETGLSNVFGIWSDGTTMWVGHEGKLHAYALATGARDAARDIEAKLDEHPDKRPGGSGLTARRCGSCIPS